MVLDRRGFIKFIAGASAGIMATPLPWKLLDDVSIWTQNWPWIPSNVKGETSYTYAVSKTCPSSAAFRVRLVGGRPVRVLPNDENHPLGGGLTALAVAEVQMLHSPGRVKRPLMRGPDGAFLELTWNKAAEILAGKLKQAGGKTAFVSGDETGSTNNVISAFAKALGSDEVYLMPSEGQCAAKAAALMGVTGQIGYDLENSDYVLALGANMLESWGTVVRNRRLFAAGNPHPDAKGKTPATFAYAGSVQNNSAAVARPWLPIYPGTEGILALGIANLLIAKGRAADAFDFGAFKALAAEYTLEKTAELTGVDPKKLESVVNSLLAAKAPLVVVGSEFSQGGGAAPVMAGFAVNALLGNINKPGGVCLLPEKMRTIDSASRSELYANDLVARLGDWAVGKDAPALLIMHEANPVYALPDPASVKQALKAVSFKVSFSTFLDETAKECDLVIPIPMGLERIDDVYTPYGSGQQIYCVSLPASEPVESVRSTANSLLYLAKQLGFDLGPSMYEELLKSQADCVKNLCSVVMLGRQPAVSDEKVAVTGYSLRPDILGKALTRNDDGNKLSLAPYAKLNLGTAKTGIPPYNTKTLRAAELDGATMSVMMNAGTAKKAGLKDGDAVVLDSGKQKISARLRVFEGVMNGTVAVCLGYGHTALDEFSQNKGANVMELLSASPEPETGLTVWSQAGVVVTKA